ncbi:hypothetical protein [uncultured Aquimarina sp.]|uniref:hypothetical protein n=1 Tax=uncultured Aquimarina sp. TaxID=575652 RepID=UPI00262D484A|nr:hypothetical protein [uncultured Aquimarina sp.]
MITKKILNTILLITIISCGQSQQNKKMTTTEYTQQDILELHKTVEHYEEETHYGVRVVAANCNFEILINDRKVFFINSNKIGSVINGAYAPINYGILKSGMQQITVRMLPPVIDRKTEIKHPKLGNSQLNIEIVADDFMEGVSTGEYSVFEWESPKEVKYVKAEGIDIPYFTQPNLPVYEHTDSFEVSVPYTIDGWSKSVNLLTNDTDELKALTEETVAIYEELRQNFQNKKRDKLANQLFNNERIMAQQIYHLEEDVKEQWNSYFEDYKQDNFKMMPLENFRLVFYGNGKMVGLEQIGPYNQWDSALFSKYVKKGKNSFSYGFYRFLLHRPKPNAKLEVI